MAPFTPEEDEKLKSAVKKRSILYNLQHKSFKDKILKDHAWLAVSSLVGRTVEECQTRWRTIRDSYFKNKKKKITGSAGGSSKSSKYDTMDLQFLDGHYNERRAAIINVDFYSDEMTHSDSATTNFSNQNTANNPKDTNKNTTNTINIARTAKNRNGNSNVLLSDELLSDDEDDELISSTNVKSSNCKSVTAPSGITRAMFIKELRESRVERRKFLHHLLQNQSDNTTGPPIGTFLKSMEEIIKTFPSDDIRQVRDDIYKIVTEKEKELEVRKDGMAAFVYVDSETGEVEKVENDSQD